MVLKLCLAPAFPEIGPYRCLSQRRLKHALKHVAYIEHVQFARRQCYRNTGNVLPMSPRRSPHVRQLLTPDQVPHVSPPMLCNNDADPVLTTCQMIYPQRIKSPLRGTACKGVPHP
jgi:hypothetical protein